MDQSVVNGVTQRLRLQMVFESTQPGNAFPPHLEKRLEHTKKVGLGGVQG